MALALLAVTELVWPAETGSPAFLELKTWEARLPGTKRHRNWQPVRPNLWETSPSDGGLGAVDHNGFGEFQASFEWPPAGLPAEKAVGFFTDCLDDAEILFLNDREIGRSGPLPEWSAGGKVQNRENVRAMSRKARFYLLPTQLLRRGTNTLRLRVFDYAGTGGFCYPQVPVIGMAEVLMGRARTQNLRNDIPRLLVCGVLLLLNTYLIYAYTHIRRRVSRRDIIRFLLGPMLRPRNPRPRSQYALDLEIGAGQITTIFLNFCLLLVLISELTFKYDFLPDLFGPGFWFTAPAVACALGAYFLLLNFHPWSFLPAEKIHRGYILLGLITHPFLPLGFALYLAILPGERAWDSLTFIGIIYWFIMLVLVALMTSFHYFKAGQTGASRVLLRQFGVFRVLALTGMIGGALFWLTGSLKARQDTLLIMSVFFAAYASMSLFFLMRHHISLRLNEPRGLPKPSGLSRAGEVQVATPAPREALHNDKGPPNNNGKPKSPLTEKNLAWWREHFPQLSPGDHKILRELYQGKSNRQIAGKLGRSEQTVKNSLSKIYQQLGVQGGRAGLFSLINQVKEEKDRG